MELTIGEKIKKLREDRGWSQETLAEKMGYNGKSSVSKIETSGDKVTLKTVEKVAKVFNVSVASIMDWEEMYGEDFANEKEFIDVFGALHDETILLDLNIAADEVFAPYALTEKEEIDFLINMLIKRVTAYNKIELSSEEELLLNAYRNKTPEEQKAFRTLLGI